MASLYAGLIAAVLEDDVITPDEQQRLRAFTKKHFITAEQHRHTLQSLGYTVEQFDRKVAQGEEVDAYVHVVTATLAECEATPEEAGIRLAAYRRKHGVDGDMHAHALKLLGMSAVQLEARCHQPTDNAIATYSALLHAAMHSQTVSQADEARRDAFRREHGISDAAHALALRSLGVSVDEYGGCMQQLYARRLEH
eukprot:5585560-Prymnesium_polylepis.1